MKFSRTVSTYFRAASLAAWSSSLAKGRYLLQVVQQLFVQRVDVLAGGDLDHGLFNVVLQLADNLVVVGLWNH